MTQLKGVIISIEDTLVPTGRIDHEVFQEVTKLIQFLQDRNIEIVVFTNRNWTLNKTGSLEEYLKQEWGDIEYLCSATDNTIPRKPKAAATQFVLDRMGWVDNEVFYIGASENDMRTAVNGNLLFLRATWWSNNTDYGFEFDSPKDIARYIDTFGFRDHLWCHEIHEANLDFYALAPFSTMKPEYTFYSKDARNAAKQGRGHPDFWIGALVSSIYFSGIHKDIDYISVYPGHKAGSGNQIMDDAIGIFGKCFRKNYIPNLILRHTTAQKSQSARRQGKAIDHLNQLNTIQLNRNPQKGNGKTYSRSPLRNGKTVLLLDDITTRGYSLASARAYIAKTGANVVLASWLKTINTNFEELDDIGDFDPYTNNTFIAAPVRNYHNYRNNMVDVLAPGELTKMLHDYENWDWPN